MTEIRKNMFQNDFLYDIMGETLFGKQQDVMRDYFKLSEQE